MNNINEAVGFYHSLQRFGIQPGLERIGALCESLGHPERNLSFVHVAGTNGKGTVSTEISNILREAGFRTGLFTSPYVIDFRERMQIDNRMIPEADLIRITELVSRSVAQLNKQGLQPTEFEAITAAAFLYFAASGCQIAVLETGLGGRFDATNIIEAPVVSVITSISYDHMQVLGDTLGQIAFEKAGIIKDHCHTVTASTQPEEAMSVIRKVAEEKNAYLFEADEAQSFEVLSADLTGARIRYRNTEMRIPFVGSHQLQNAAVALKACEVIGVSGFDITVDHIRKGLAASFIPARVEILHTDPVVILDGSHNQDSLKALSEVLRDNLAGKKILAVMGMMADKDCDSSIQRVSELFSKVICVTPSNPRAMRAEDFSQLLQSHNVAVQAVPDPKTGIDTAMNELISYDALIVCGSLYLAADIRDYLLNKLSDLD